MIRVDNLARSYGDFMAVDDVSFQIGPGEVVGLLGHNGAGKTTIMKMMTGFLEPSAGRIEIDGLDIRDQRQTVQQRIGYLPENCPLYPEMTVLDYLAHQAGLHGIPDDQLTTAVAGSIRRTRLEAKAESTISTLSRGYRQRVGVAQALLHHPKILILDEPTNGLDPTQIHHMRDLIRELSKEATVILSTHILQEVQAVCDRVLIIRAGKLVLDSRLEELSQAQRLLVSVDRAQAEAETAFTGIGGVAKVEPIAEVDGRHRYALSLGDQDAATVAPKVAKAVAEQGFQLYELTPEVRDLETLFRDLESEPLNQEVSNA